MRSKSYWVVTDKGGKATSDAEEKPPYFGILTKNEKGSVSLVAYKNEKDLDEHVQWLGKEYVNAKTVFENSFGYPDISGSTLGGLDDQANNTLKPSGAAGVIDPKTYETGEVTNLTKK